MGVLIEVEESRWGRRQGHEVQVGLTGGAFAGPVEVVTATGSMTYVFGQAGVVSVEHVSALQQPSQVADDPLWWAPLSSRRNAVLHRLVAVFDGVYLTACGRYCDAKTPRDPEAQDRCARCLAHGWQ